MVGAICSLGQHFSSITRAGDSRADQIQRHLAHFGCCAAVQPVRVDAVVTGDQHGIPQLEPFGNQGRHIHILVDGLVAVFRGVSTV